jgi:hypothetical protein
LLAGLAPPEVLPEEPLEEVAEDDDEPVDDEDELLGAELVAVVVAVLVVGGAAATVEVGTVSVETPPVSAEVEPPPPHALSGAAVPSTAESTMSRRRSIARAGLKNRAVPSACRSAGSR